MKRLSDFHGEKAFQVVADLLVPIGNMAVNANKLKAKIKDGDDVSQLEFISELLKSNYEDMKTIFAIMNDADPATYDCTAASILLDAMTAFNDPLLAELFGLQSQTATSFGSASESTEV